MLKFVAIILSGMAVGFLLRKRPLKVMLHVVTVLIWLLLFFLGIEVGENPQVVGGISRLGLEALWLSLAGLVGTILFSWALWRWVNASKKSAKNTSGDTLTSDPSGPNGESEHQGTGQAMKGSLIIVGFFVLGVVCGVMHWLPDLNAFGNVSLFTLFALLFCVGVTVGNNTTLLKSFTQLDPRLMLLPLMTIVGTLAITAIASLCLPHRSLTDSLAVGSGFGYYSLSSILITQYRGPELGTVALLANIIREIFTLLSAPLLVKYFGPLSPISCGGATTMDTTLPIITRTSGQDFVLLSLFHGFLVDFSVPFLVTFWCTI